VIGSLASGNPERLRNIDPACFICAPASGRSYWGDNMTIARIIAITAVIQNKLHVALNPAS